MSSRKSKGNGDLYHELRRLWKEANPDSSKLASEKAVIEWWGVNKHKRDLIEAKIDNFKLVIEDMGSELLDFQPKPVQKRGRKRKLPIPAPQKEDVDNESTTEAQVEPSQKIRLKSLLARRTAEDSPSTPDPGDEDDEVDKVIVPPSESVVVASSSSNNDNDNDSDSEAEESTTKLKPTPAQDTLMQELQTTDLQICNLLKKAEESGRPLTESEAETLEQLKQTASQKEKTLRRLKSMQKANQKLRDKKRNMLQKLAIENPGALVAFPSSGRPRVEIKKKRQYRPKKMSSSVNSGCETVSSSSLETGLFQKVVLVTGAASGIGRAAAIEFFKLGCRLVITDTNYQGLLETSLYCLTENPKISGSPPPETNIHQIPGDLQNSNDCKRVVDETVSKFGQLDVLINSAGILSSGDLKTLSLNDYEKQMNGNTRSAFLTTQAAVPHLRNTKGSVVNVSSVPGLPGVPGAIPHSLSKAALDQLTRCTALELAQDGIRVNSVNPGPIVDTNTLSGMSEAEYHKMLQVSKTTNALGRFGMPEEVVKSIVFLASNELSGFLTGVTLSVDGGRGIMSS